MKRLLTISALLLFSVDVFADDEYCYVDSDNFVGLTYEVQDKCDEDDVLYASVPANYGTFDMNMMTLWYCDFENEIIINSDNINTYLICVLNDNEPRETDSAPFE